MRINRTKRNGQNFEKMPGVLKNQHIEPNLYHDMQCRRWKGGLISKLSIGLFAGALSFGAGRASGEDWDLRFSGYSPDKVGSSMVLYLGHVEGQTEGEYDYVNGLDLPWSRSPPDFNGFYSDARITGETITSQTNLFKDIRGLGSETPFQFNMFLNDPNSEWSYDNRVYVDFYESEDEFNLQSNRAYFVEFNMPKENRGDGVNEDFSKKYNLRIGNPDQNGHNWYEFPNLSTNVPGQYVHDDYHDREYFGDVTIKVPFNDLHFLQPSNGVVAVTNIADSSTITNGQRFVYNDMVDASVNVTANTGYHLLGLDVVRTDINSGDRYTNSVSFPDTVGSYVSNFSTNLEDLVGDNRIENVQIGADKTSTTNGIPYSWLASHGITNYSDSVESENPDSDGMDNLAEYIADTDPQNSRSYFCVIAVTNLPPVTLYFNSSTNRRYTMEGCTNPVSGSWTNVLGAGPRKGRGSADSMSDTNQPPHGPFYRLEVNLP